jgi:hypothetical protein
MIPDIVSSIDRAEHELNSVIITEKHHQRPFDSLFDTTQLSKNAPN